MAKPIEPTPTLKGKDADKFVELTHRTEANPDPEKAKFLEECFLLYSRFKF